MSLNGLVETTDVKLDTNTLNRIQDIDKLNQKDKELGFEFPDSSISSRKIKKALYCGSGTIRKNDIKSRKQLYRLIDSI